MVSRRIRLLVSCMFTILSIAAFTPWQAAAQESTFEEYSASSGLSSDHGDVFRLYWAFFDRAPDVSGARYWAEQSNKCVSLLAITWSFANSSEFISRYGRLSDGQFVDLVYKNVLGRAADVDGKNYWLNELAAKRLSQPEVMLYFSLGDEFKRRHPLPTDTRTASSGCVPATDPVPEYSNCTEVRQAGAAPIHRGEPGYGPHLDGDGDGIACE